VARRAGAPRGPAGRVQILPPASGLLIPRGFFYDNEPDPGRKKADTRYIVGVGWEF
jgi:hypothetical protein